MYYKPQELRETSGYLQIIQIIRIIQIPGRLSTPTLQVAAQGLVKEIQFPDRGFAVITGIKSD